MTLKTFKPYTKSTRGTILVEKNELWKGKPFKSLVFKKNASKGRNNIGHITSRNRAGGHKKMYRQVDFYRKKFDMEAVVERLEYDPNYWLESIWSEEYQTRTYTDGTQNKKLTCLYKKITLPKGFFDGTLLADYDYHASSKDTFNKRITIHQAIMWTFRPWKDYPPKGIDPEVCQNLDPKTPLKQYSEASIQATQSDCIGKSRLAGLNLDKKGS